MREIKFRSWLGGVIHPIWYTIDPEQNERLNKGIILMQYTGLKDKNGKGRWSKEIYEGDIVGIIKSGKNFVGEKYVIKYQEEWASFIADQGEGGGLLFLAKDGKWTDGERLLAVEVEVIGNIYENPELLKS
jgi:uncharacterized phage protein (TIGR01671 family)